MIVDITVCWSSKSIYRKEEEAKVQDSLVIKEKVTKKTDRMPLAPLISSAGVLCWLLVRAY
jgi:hypothetical protein